jgi:predicted outer membrane repeat protein
MYGINLMLWRRIWLLLAVTVVGVLGMSGTAMAGAAFTVNDAGDYAQGPPNSVPSDLNWGKCASVNNGSCTLRAAVEAADELGGPSTITLPAGVYKFALKADTSTTANAPWNHGWSDPTTGDLDVNALDNGASITINGAGSVSTVINANEIDRVFSVEYNAQGNSTYGGLTLSGVTLQNGSPADYSDPRYQSSDGSEYGGAIFSDGALTISGDVVMVGNGVGDYGGAIYLYKDAGSTASIMGAQFLKNFSDYEGGVIWDDSPNGVSISKSVFDNNAVDEYGGAVYLSSNGNMTVDHTTFSQNNSEYYGGAFYWDGDGTLTVTNSTFAQNTAAYYEGGAIDDESSSGMSFSNTRFFGNSSGYDEGGGVLYADNSSGCSNTYRFTNDQLDYNSAQEYGGAILLY